MKVLIAMKEELLMHTAIQIEKGPINRAKLTLGYVLLLLLAL